MKNILLLLALLLNLSGLAFAQQSKIDSLENVLKNAKEDTAKVHLLNKLCVQYIAVSDFPKAMDYAEKELELSEQLKYKFGTAEATFSIGRIHYLQGNYTAALEYQSKALKLYEALDAKPTIASTLQNIGNIYWALGNYSVALEYYLKSLKVNEAIGNKGGVATSQIAIGLIYYQQSNFEKALEYFFQALEQLRKSDNKTHLALVLSNIGVVYKNQNDLNKALEYYNESLKIREEIGDKSGIGDCLANLSSLYTNQKKYEKALETMLRVLKIKEESGEKKDIARSLGNLAGIYWNLKNYNQAIEYGNKGLALAKEIGDKEDMGMAYKGLSEAYRDMSNYERAYEYHQLYSEMKDSLFNEDSQKQIAEMSTKYETEKKEKEILLLNKDKEIQGTELKRQKVIRNAVVGGLLLVVLFSFVLINRLLLIRQQKKVIEIEREKSEKLLLNILPKEIAEELKNFETVKPRNYEMVTVLFTDFKGFTTIAEKMSAEELVSELDFIFKKFDEIISRYPIEKIKTIGDAYMCAGGLPVANTTNPMDVVMAGLEIQEWMKAQNKWQLRLGIHTGNVIAGVVGDKKFAYDIWGDTVNTASRMESSGEAGKVNISGSTHQLLQNSEFRIQNSELEYKYRGKITAKNKGEIEMYFVEKK